MTIDLAGNGDRMDIEGAHNAITVSGDQTTVRDYRHGHTVTLSGDGDRRLSRERWHDRQHRHQQLLHLTGTQTVTVTGADTSVVNDGTAIAVTFSADNEWIDMTGSGNTTTVTGDHGTVYDEGTGNLTVLNGDDAYAVLSGEGGTLSGTGSGRAVLVQGTAKRSTCQRRDHPGRWRQRRGERRRRFPSPCTRRDAHRSGGATTSSMSTPTPAPTWWPSTRRRPRSALVRGARATISSCR